MAKGNFGNTDEHKRAGHMGGEATAEEHQSDDFYSKIGQKGGHASQQGSGHKLTEEDRSKGGQAVSQNREHMSEIGKKGGQH